MRLRTSSCTSTPSLPGEYEQHRGLAECEAGSVAYVLSGIAGLDTSAYSVGYIATWTHGDTDLIRVSAGNVLAAVGQLAGALTDPTDPHDQAD